MSLLQQIIQLLIEPPGNVIYHLITLFVLQVVFALSVSQVRRDHTDLFARRMVWAAGLVFLGRVGVLVVSLAVGDEPLTAVSLLPPLEQALHTGTAVLVVWAVGAASSRWPRLGNVAAALALAVVGVMYLSFAPAWRLEVAQGITSYNSSNQAVAWGVYQLIILGAGFILTVAKRPLWFSLRQILILVLLIAHIAQFQTFVAQITTTQSDIAYLVRLGHLISFPLWAAAAYLHTLTSLLQKRHPFSSSASQISDTLQRSTQVLRSLETAELLPHALQFVDELIAAPFIGIALSDSKNPQQMRITSNQPQIHQNRPRSWNLNLGDWPGLRLAMEEKRLVELLPNGLGAKQLREWYEEMGVAPLGAMLIQPLLVNNSSVGLLLLSAYSGRNRWSDSEKELAGSLAVYLAQVIDNSQTYSQTVKEASALPVVLQPERETAVSGRIIALEEERSQLKAELETSQSRQQQAEIRAAESAKQARDLAATLEEMERADHNEEIEALKAEASALRESLIEAEEALAMASAGVGGLSAEWVMMTISRYSGQLEEAQARIQFLEAELTHQNRGMLDEVVVSLIQELRTPMTSIAGYTNLLLGETLGILGVKQRDFLQRIKGRAEQMETLLAQLVQLTTHTDQTGLVAQDWVDVREVLESAVDTVMSQIREKKIRLDLDVASRLPLLSVSRKAMHQIITNLLANACQVSNENGRIAITAHPHSIAAHPGTNDQTEKIDFLQVAITDNGGGISIHDLSRVFDPHHRADDPLIAGLGDTGAGMAVARTLTEANGGRIWVASQTGQGSTFSLLFPITTPEFQQDELA